MLGFSIKPTWWNDVYGPAPYTSNNLILWEDLEQGKIAEPNKATIYDKRFVRPGLTKHIPVDDEGNLISPLASNYASGHVLQFTKLGFVFGDSSPAEYAWRKSSDYPFSIIKSWLLNQPAKVFGIGWDLSRISKNLSGQIVYDKIKPISAKNLQFTNIIDDTTRIFTSGLVNYVVGYVLDNGAKTVNDYRSDLQSFLFVRIKIRCIYR